MLNFVSMPPSSITASSTMPRLPKVLVGTSLPSPTEYCAETLVDLASQPVTTNKAANSCDKIIWKEKAGLTYKLIHFLYIHLHSRQTGNSNAEISFASLFTSSNMSLYEHSQRSFAQREMVAINLISRK